MQRLRSTVVWTSHASAIRRISSHLRQLEREKGSIKNGWLRRRKQRRVHSRISEEELLQQEKRFREVAASHVEKATKLLDEIIGDVIREISVIQSIGYIYEEQPKETEAEIIRTSVKQHLNSMDQNFLASLESFQLRAKEMGSEELARIIKAIKEEVMEQTKHQFPPEVLLLEDLMELPSKSDRIALIKRVADAQEVQTTEPDQEAVKEQEPLNPYLSLRDDVPFEELDLEEEMRRLKILKDESGLKGLKEELEKENRQDVIEPVVISDMDSVMESIEDPLADMEPESTEEAATNYGKPIGPLKLGLAASQFISDIEEKEEIANRSLLAKLCTIREEARLVELEMRFAGVEMEEDPIKFRENVPNQVMAVIQTLIRTADSIQRVGFIRKIFEKDEYAPLEKDLTRAPGYVRPGIFMTALTMTQMEADERSKHKATAKQIPNGFLHRIDDIRLEAMLVLRELGWGAFSSEELARQQKERSERLDIPTEENKG